ASFENVLLDEKCFDLRETVQRALAAPTNIVGIETPPAATRLNLLPQSWRDERSRHERRAQWTKRLRLAGFGYLAIIAVFLLQLGYAKLRIAQLDRQIRQDAPRAAFVRSAAQNWKALAPAMDPHFYPVDILLH